ncbi:xanthine dehydrogenase family protein molybdopterin-binding subunit [Demetria terragena]|uniref:xanthine dehydrogenase family protein molybdopterin-binding subunit n=1 Tax=Demetria terragena TaxID=63959 RepID=UPI00037925DA|nr:xanthine dehydrogenase family protein molybdopterin-binding subunit [Demetria terragena]
MSMYGSGAAIGDGILGRSVPRVEDERLLRGQGRFVDDLRVDGALEVAFLRSPVAHAHITRIDIAAARASPGVVAVYDGAQIAARVEPLVNTEELRIPEGILNQLDPIVRVQPSPLLAVDEVVYVGQPVAMVIAESRYLAEDALELIEVEYDNLPAVLDPEAALADDAPKVLTDAEDNIGLQVAHGKGDVDAAFAQAAVVVSETFASQRYVASPMECRGMLASHDPFTGALTIWSNTQTPHRVRNHLASSLELDPESVRVVSVDVGGGFGQKGILIVEEVLVPFAAHDLGRPVRWQEDRNENLMAGTHAREQVHHVDIAADAEGRILGLRDRMIVNLGSRNMVGLVVPYNSLAHLMGPYKVPTLEVVAVGALTHTMCTAPYRGAGRPEVTFAMERAIDRLAVALDMDPWEVRRRNVVRPEEMPYLTGILDRRGEPQEYDSGDYPQMLDRIRDLVDLSGFRERQVAARADGRHLGIGFSMYLEATGLGPFEGGKVTVLPSGRVRVHTGAPSQGQGHRTTFAQIAAAALGVRVEDVEVVAGDTSDVPFGVGTMASRALVTAGNAIHQAAVLVKERILTAAAELLEIDSGKLDLVDGRVRVAGAPEQTLSLAEVLRSLPMRAHADGRDSLSETSYFQPPNYATSSGLHAAVVDVDIHTGRVEIEDYVVVHEAGRIVNPMIADAQIVGGVVQGLGGALLEHMQYDDAGQPVTTTFMDYLIPTATSVPDVRLDEISCPSPTNTLGVKGLGEGGAVGPPAAIANAVEDALRPFGVVVRSCPLTPARVRELVRSAAGTTMDAKE